MFMADARVKILLDASIYIPFINKGVSYPFLELEVEKPVVYLSAVVIKELYAGAFDNNSIELLDELYGVFYSTGRLIVPFASDWQKAGKVVAKLGRKYGFEEKFLSKIQNDVLIALSARQIGAILVTHNAKDFLRIKEFVDFKVYGEGY